MGGYIKYDYDNYVTQTDGQGPDVGMYKGKIIVDSVAAGISYFGTPGKVVAGVYGVFDGIAQSRPEYVPNYGSQAGRAVGGWTAIGARDFDNQVQRVIDGNHVLWGPKN